MTVFTEAARPLEFLLTEGNGNVSRDNILIKDGEGILPPGRVIGVVTSGNTNEIGRYRSCDPTNSDGSQTAVAILGTHVDATHGDQPAIAITRDAEVNGKLLTFDANADLQSEKETMMTALATHHIIVRD